MDDSKKKKEAKMKMKYVEPELVPLDKDQTVEGGSICGNGSGELYSCSSGGGVLDR